MTDHRITDLSFGLPGKASYDTEERRWSFTADFDKENSIEQISPFIQCVSNSFKLHSVESEPRYHTTSLQMKWLQRVQPETFPGSSIIAAYTKIASVSENEAFSTSGSLLAAGYAYDATRISGTRIPRIVAIPGPEADALLLIRPRVEVRGWGKKSEASLDVFDLKSADHGYWAGVGGGIIRQVLFRDNENEPEKLFAVRQDRATTILRPLFGKGSELPLSKKHLKAYRPSRISPNPIACLTVEATGSETHEDVAFNPWYSSQFAVIDSSGSWSTWNLESQRTFEKLAPGKRGQFFDDLDTDVFSKTSSENDIDGWYRVLWACNANTLVLCNRQRLAIFDIKGTPARFEGCDILPPTSKEWILDIKLSISNMNHVYVLTTLRLFWIEVIPKVEAIGEVKIILSYRHFRDANDETMKLTLVEDENVSVLLASEKSPVVNFYGFSSSSTESPTSWKGSFALTGTPDERKALQIQSLCFLPIPLTNGNSQPPSGESWFEPNTNFFQVLILNPELGLTSMLCAIRKASHSVLRHRIMAPIRILRKTGGRVGPQAVNDHFVVRDGCEEDIPDESKGNSAGKVYRESRVLSDSSFRINWSNVFCQAFSPPSPSDDASGGLTTMADIIARITARLQDYTEKEILATSTLIELSNRPVLSGDLEQASLALSAYLAALQLDRGPDFPVDLIMADLSSGPGIIIPRTHDAENLDMLKVFDHLMENWMASLPMGVSNAARGAKFKIIHQLALEICLSAVALSFQNKTSSVKTAMLSNIDQEVPVPSLERETGYSGHSRDDSSALFSSQLASLPDYRASLGLPTPDQTPSLYSHTTSASELKEDPAVTRLRQYAVSIKAKPDFGTSSILSHWPSVPGHDPAEYSWAEAQKSLGTNEEAEESDRKSRKEDARRRRRTERFLRQERARAADSMSQPVLPRLAPFGSDPILPHDTISSQPMNDLPMTQPDRGTFGGRTAKKIKKKPKKSKPRTAGFR